MPRSKAGVVSSLPTPPIHPLADGWQLEWPTEIDSCWWFNGWLGGLRLQPRRTYFVEVVQRGVLCTVHGRGDLVLPGQAFGLWKRVTPPEPSLSPALLR